MFARLTRVGGEKTQVIAQNVLFFDPAENGGTDFTFIGGSELTVRESNQTVRNRFKQIAADAAGIVTSSQEATAD